MLVSPNVSSIRELKPKPVIMEEWGQVRSRTIRHFWLILRQKFLALTVTWEMSLSCAHSPPMHEPMLTPATLSIGIPASSIDCNRESERKSKTLYVFLTDLDHADMAAAPGPAPTKHQAHGAAPEHPRQPGEVRVDVRLDVLLPQSGEVLAQPPGDKFPMRREYSEH